MKTSLGEEENLILAEFDKIVRKWAKKLNKESTVVESAIAYLWASRKLENEREFDNWLSAHDMGPYGGR